MGDELLVIKKSKKLAMLIFEITELSPKKFRHSLVLRMQNFSIDLVSALYMANDTVVNLKLIEDYDKSIKYLSERENRTPEMLKDDEKIKLFELKINRANMFAERVTKRMDHCFEAVNALKKLDWLLLLAKETDCITEAQFKKTAPLLLEVRRLLAGFIKSDRKRYNF